METVLKTAPTVEPLTRAEMKRHLRLDESDSSENTDIDALIVTARTIVEHHLNRKLITQTWYAYFDDFPNDKDYIALPFGSLQSVTAVKYTDSDDVEHTWDSSEYTVDTQSYVGRIVLNYSEVFPSETLATSNPIEIEFECGYGDEAANVPYPIRHAIKMVAADLYEHRQDIVYGTNVEISKVADALLMNYRIFNL